MVSDVLQKEDSLMAVLLEMSSDTANGTRIWYRLCHEPGRARFERLLAVGADASYMDGGHFVEVGPHRSEDELKMLGWTTNGRLWCCPLCALAAAKAES